MKVAIVGMGYVGRPLFDLFQGAGVDVGGYDVEPSKCEAWTPAEKHYDVWIICVPTPLDKSLAPDLSYVDRAVKWVAQQAHAGDLVVLESTTYPGTTRERVVPAMPKGVLVAYSPERIDPGSNVPLNFVPKLVGGHTPEALDRALEVYCKAFDDMIPCPSMEVAEAAKLLENIFRCVNIAMVNELKMIFDKLGIDVWKVISAASTKPYGFMPFYPGPGLGGHCIPIDPFYLSWIARGAGVPTRFIELAGEINREMPHWVVEKVSLALNQSARAVMGSHILLLGITYKPDVPDDRESPTYAVEAMLRNLGARVVMHDPTLGHEDPHPELYDCVVLMTAHSSYDLDDIESRSRILVDTRGVCHGENVVKA